MFYTELRNDYLSGPAVGDTQDPDENLFARITIDGWKTDDDNEEGVVIASVIMTEHGDLVTDWHDNGARMANNVLEAIADAKQKLQALYAEQCGTGHA